MRKFYSIVLLAAGLLIGTSVWANLPQRPLLGQQNPQSAELRISPQGVEQLVPMATPQPKHSQSSLARAPRRVATGDGNIAKVVHSDKTETFYADETIDNIWLELVEGDYIVLLDDVYTYWAEITKDNVTLDLNGHYLISSYASEPLQYQFYLICTTGNNIVIKNGYVWDDNYTFIYSDGKTYNNYGIEAWGGSLTLENVTTDGYWWGSAFMIYAVNNATVEIKDCEINSCFYAVYNAGADITINQSEGKECKLEGHCDASFYQKSAGSLTLNGGTIYNEYSGAKSVFLYGGDFTMNGGKLSATKDALYVYSYYGNATVEINGGSIVGGSENRCIYTCEGNSKTMSLTINDGYISSTNTSRPIVDMVYGTGYIKGGTFYSEATSCIMNSYGALYVSGGRFDCPIYKEDGVTDFMAIELMTGGEIYGGTYNNAVKMRGFKAGYDYYSNPDGTYTIKKNIAKIAGSDANYSSLQEAIDAAGNGDEISLIVDATENVTISGKEITFDANGKTLEGNMTAANGAVLNIISTGTIKGSLIQNGGTVKVYTGKFTENPTAFVQVAENCSVTGPTEGIYTVVQGVAKIGETTYTSFAEAIAAANTLEDTTVTLLANARLANEALNVEKSMTIDLNGHSLSSVNTKTSYLRFGTANTEVTIKNGTITNAATATQFSEGLVSLSANNQVTLDNVTINHKAKAAVTLLTETAKLIVNSNCTLNGKEYGVYIGNGILENNATSVKVGVGDNDAQITNNVGASMTLVANGVNTKTLTLSNQGSLEITDGIYNGTINVDGTIAISGGIFYDAVKATMESYKVANKNWNQMVYKGNAAWDLHSDSETVIATVDGLNYYSLDDAIQAIAADKSEKTIILQHDINTIYTSNSRYTISAGKYIKLDLNGNNILAENANRRGNAIMFDVEMGAKLTIDDNSENHNGTITNKNSSAEVTAAYTIHCKGTVIVNNGTVQNISPAGNVRYCVQLEETGIFTINNGLVLSTVDCAIRYWPGKDTRSELNINGGEVKGYRTIWVQLPAMEPGKFPYGAINMTDGKLTSMNEDALYILSHGGDYRCLEINVSGGIITGNFVVGAGSEHGGEYNEKVSLSGGTFVTSNAFYSEKRGIEHRTISGGAYYFDETTSKNDYIKFCEYIKNGHYAVKMCRDDANGTLTFDNIDGKYTACEGDTCVDGTFWAIIDGEGEKEPQDVEKNGEWSDGTDGVFEEGKIPDIHTDVLVKGDTIEIMSGVDAEANRLVVDTGAGIIVHDGATLNVGSGGIEVNSDGTGTTYIVVEAGGTIIANGTVISQNVDEIRVEADANGVGTVLLEPSLDYNNQPMSTVDMYTYARYIPEQDKYIWQHFGIPTLKAPDTIYNNRGCQTQFWQWNYELGDWEQVKYKQKQVNTPFRGYNLKTKYEGTDGVTYTFTGKILGNGDATFDLKPGFNFYANSYLAPINAQTLIDEIGDDNIEWTVWMYDGQKDNFDMINEISLLFGEDCEIPALRGFFLKLSSGTESTAGINYESTVWKNAISKSGATGFAPARQKMAEDMSLVQISLADNYGKGDKMYLAQSSQFDAGFNNGFDASKQMSEESANLYATTLVGDLAIVATDNLDGLYLSMNTKNENVYTLTFTQQKGDVFQLVDLYTNRTIPMTEGATYTFTASENAVLNNRFQIRRAQEVVTDLESTGTNNNEKEGIYTVLGQYVGGVNEWSVLPTGMYIVNGKKIVK